MECERQGLPQKGALDDSSQPQQLLSLQVRIYISELRVSLYQQGSAGKMTGKIPSNPSSLEGKFFQNQAVALEVYGF